MVLLIMHMRRFIIKWLQELFGCFSGSLLFTSIGFDSIGESMHVCSKDKSIHVHILVSILFVHMTYTQTYFHHISTMFSIFHHKKNTILQHPQVGFPPPRWAGRTSNVDSHHAAANDDSEPINMRHCKQYLPRHC